MLATSLLAKYPTAHAFASAIPRRIAKLRYDGEHFVGPELTQCLVEAVKRSVDQHHGLAYKLKARHFCQLFDILCKRLSMANRPSKLGAGRCQ